MILNRTRKHNGLSIPETNARYANVFTSFAGPHIDRYLETAFDPDADQFLAVANGIKAYLGSASRHEYGSDSSLDDEQYNATQKAKRVSSKPQAKLPPVLATQQADRASRAEVAALSAAHAGSSSSSSSSRQSEQDIEVVSLYKRDFEDWSARGMASKVHRDRKLDWGSCAPAPFAAKLEDPLEKEVYVATAYRTVYQDSVSGLHESAHGIDEGLPASEIVRFYGGDVLRESVMDDVAEWYSGLDRSGRDEFQDVMRRFSDFLKRTTTATGHDWRTLALGERSKLSITRHAYESSHSLVNASVSREKPKLLSQVKADEAAASRAPGALRDENDAAAIHQAALDRTGGSAINKPTFDARRGTSLASEGYGIQSAAGTNARLLDTTYDLAFNADDVRRAQPPLPVQNYHHLKSSIPDMVIGQKADRDTLVTSYQKVYTNKHQRSRDYRAQSVKQTNQWTSKTFV